MKNINKIKIIFIALFLFYAPGISANTDDFYSEFEKYFDNISSDTVIFENKVNASSNTGNNGKASSEINVRTIINGKVVENVEIKKEDGELNQEIKYDSKIELNENKLKIETTKELNGVVEEESQELELSETDRNVINKELEKLEVIKENSTKEKINVFINKEEEIEDANKEINIESNDVGPLEESKDQELIQFEEKEETAVYKFISLILDIFKKNVDRIVSIF